MRNKKVKSGLKLGQVDKKKQICFLYRDQKPFCFLLKDQKPFCFLLRDQKPFCFTGYRPFFGAFSGSLSREEKRYVKKQ